MARRTFTNIVLALGLLCSIAASTNVGAQQVTFALSPAQVTPAVGDTLKMDLSVQNFTNIVSLQYALEWDGALLAFIAVDSVNIPDRSNFSTNPVGNNTVLTVWNASGPAKSVPNGQRLYRLRYKVLAASSNYWIKFSTTNIDVIEVIQDPGQRSVTPSFVNLGIPPGNATIPVAAKITSAATLTSQKVCVPVTTSDFTNIVSAQWLNKWNPSVLRFDSISTLNNTLGLTMGNFSTLQTSSGRVAFSWNASSGSVSVNNNDTLYKVCYTAVGANGTNSIVTFDSSEVYRRGVGGDARVSLNSVNGTVTVGTALPPTSSNFTIAVSNHNVNSGDTVCLKLRVGAFTNIAVIQWSMHWDSTKMSFLGASSTAGVGIKPWVSPTDFGDFGYKTTGSLGFVWFDGNGTGITLVDSTILMEICFKYIGAANTSSTFRFDGIPVKLKITDGNFVVIPPTFRNGTVTAGTAAVPTSFTSVVKNVTCPSGSDGTITLTPSGGNGTYTYAWAGPSGFTASSKDLETRLSGKYYVTVTSNATTKVDSFTIAEPTAFAISSQVTNVNCKGGATGAIALTVAGGTAPYTYAWTGTTTTPTAKDLTGLTAGIYKLTLTDAKNCVFNRADTIKEPLLALTVATVPTNSDCKNGNTGAIATTVSGGTSPYTYSWISANGTAANTKDLTALAVGTYNLTVTDANGCKATRVETLTEPDSITIGAANIVGTRCSQLTGKITIASVAGGNAGGYTFSWVGPNSSTFGTQDLTNIGAGQYTLTVKDSKNCASAATVYSVVDTAANITNSVPSVTNVLCFGGNDGAISLTATGANALTYAWTGPNGFTATTLSISNLKAGNYTLSISEAGCSKTIAASVNEPAAIASAKQSVNVKCKGEASGSIALNATGGTAPLSIAWTGPNGFTATGQSVGSLKVGTYLATISDANGCSKPESVTITEPLDSLKITNAAVTNVACNAGINGAITLTVAGGTPQYNYAWTGVGGFTSIQKDLINRSAGEYRVSVTDANGCRIERILNITEPGVIVVTAGTTDASGTPNGTISLSMAGGQAPFTFLWTGQGVVPTAQNQTGLCPGTYSVSVKDAGQCAVSKSITVGGSCSTPMRILGAPSVTPAGCVGNNFGRISINFEGGVAPFNVVWVQIIGNGGNNPDVFSEIVQARSSTLAGRQAGTYAVKITDAVGQTLATPPIVINGSSTPITITAAISNETCRGNDGSIILTITDAARPYLLTWTDDNTVNNVLERSNLKAKTYAASVKDANGCIKDMGDMVVRRTPCPLVITSSRVNPTCFGGTNGSITINIANGEPTYTVTSPTGQIFNLPNVSSRTNTYPIENLSAGTYTVTIKDTINAPQTLTFTLTAPPQITVDRRVTGDQGSCNGSIILTVSGGVQPYTYQWNTGATSRDLFNLCCNDGRRYSVGVTDANRCLIATPNDTISCSIAVLSLDSSKIRDPLCKSDSTNSRIEVYIKGGVVPYVSEWRNSTGTVVATNTLILFSQPPGRYYLTVQDSRVPNPQRLVYDGVLKIKSTLAILSPSTTDASDNDKPDGTTTITINPGEAPYTIRWQDGSTTTTSSTTATNSALKAGTGEVTVTDLLGCIVKQTVTIGSRACATIRKNTVFYTPNDTFNIRCAGFNDGGASIIAFRSDVVSPIRAYEWKSSGETGQTAFKLAAGINVIKITDANGKVCESSFNMKAPPLLKDTIWIDDKMRTLEAIPSGGVAPYTYSWTTDNADKTRKVTVNRSGTYYVVVRDALGCDVSDKARIDLDATCLDGSIVLTPNDDGRNENFRFKSCSYKVVRLEVYNRWGQLVYSSNDYREQWFGNKEDGQFGDPLPEGVYMYILSGTDASGKQQLGKGTVNIVRN